MRTLLIGSCLATLAVTGTAALPAEFVPLRASELTSLRALDAPGLAGLRAGRTDTRLPVGAAERVELRAAQSANPDLASLRAGDLTNSTLLTILLVLAIIVVVVVLV